MRQLVVCCDGTWQKPRDRTNVHRFAAALAPVDVYGHEQRCQYFPGVGANGFLVTRVTGGVAGEGLSEKVVEAYCWVATTFREGDRISLFGFSRGAYTARSVAGMISACGLLDLSGLSGGAARGLVERVYEEKYRAGNAAQPSWRRGLGSPSIPSRRPTSPSGSSVSGTPSGPWVSRITSAS
jgi:hypothetical protein